MYLKTRYALSLKFVLAQVRGNNHWSTSQVQLNYRTLPLPRHANVSYSEFFNEVI